MSTHVVSTREAKSRMSELIPEAERRRDVIVARNGHPVAKKVPWPPRRPPRVAGAWSGRVSSTTDQVAPDVDIAATFDDAADG